MRLEQLAERYSPSNSCAEEGISYSRLELYALSVTRFYTGPLDNSLSPPLGGGLVFGGESIFDRMDRLARRSPPLRGSVFEGQDTNINVNPEKTQTAYARLFSNDNYTAGITHHPAGFGKFKVYDRENREEYGVPLVDISKPLAKWRIEKK